MSRLLGEMRQVGIVVRDIEAAMTHWVEVCGVGPWFYTDKLAVTEFSYRGTRCDDIHVSIALANSGDVQLELIQQRCATPSIYRDFLAAGHEGMQHWSSWPVDYDETLKKALASGYTVGQQGDSARGRFVYLWNEGHPGTVIEMAHMTEARRPHLRCHPRRRRRLGRARPDSAQLADVTRRARRSASSCDPAARRGSR